MKINLTILDVGVLRDERLRKKYKNYCCIFGNVFKETLGKKCELEISCTKVLKGKLPSSIENTDIWVITGSRNSVFDDEDWLKNFRHFVKDLYKRNGLIIGFCFGHQLMADVLGGKVERFSGGWGIGIQDFNVSEDSDFFEKSALSFPVCYQDQVISQPKDTKILLSSEFCNFASLSYPNGSLSVQFHPEFSYNFISHLLGIVRNDSNLSRLVYDNAVESLEQFQPKSANSRELDNHYFFEKLSNYLISLISDRRKELKAS